MKHKELAYSSDIAEFAKSMCVGQSLAFRYSPNRARVNEWYRVKLNRLFSALKRDYSNPVHYRGREE